MMDLAPLKDIPIWDVLESLSVHVPDNVKHRRTPQIRCPLPNHEERSPSFTIYPATNGWHCFGCGEGNDVIDLVQVMTGMDFRGAVDYLSLLAGIEVGQAQQREMRPEDLFPLVADQAHADVRKWVWALVHRDDPSIRGVSTVEFIDEVFAVYDEIRRQHRNGEIDAQDGIKRMLAWRAHWRSRLQ